MTLRRRLEQFYGSSLGNRLIETSRFPSGIRHFLSAEKRMIDRAAAEFDLLVEVGCMHGRYLDWAVRNEKSYLGIDLVRSSIAAARRSVAERGLDARRFGFIMGSGERVGSLLKSRLILPNNLRPVLLYPFNSFGNMRSPKAAILALARVRLPFLISTYSTSERATSCRQRYYSNCGYRALRLARDERGVAFVSPEGLRSFAYHRAYLEDLFVNAGLDLVIVPFATIGLAYTTLTSVANPARR